MGDFDFSICRGGDAGEVPIIIRGKRLGRIN